MKKKILLTIKGNHLSTKGQNSSIELITEGCLFEKDGAYHIEYEESEISGMEGTTTKFSLQDNSVIMQRSGSNPSLFMFEQGKKYINSYSTPAGSISMGIYPTKVEHQLGEEEGKLDLKYQLDIDGIHTGVNELMLYYK
jgi:uncharacterized beta-barrel protein YwiB (DUF1934 family)